MAKELSSIIMSCYNGRDYIDRSFTSILKQDYPNIELVFVDDGSSDDSYAYANSFAPLFNERGYNLLTFKQNNQGLGFAAIDMIDKINGKYISYLDVDDELDPLSVKLRVEALENKKDINVVRTNAYKCFAADNSRQLLVVDEEEKKGEHLFEQILLGKANNYAGTYMVRADTVFNFYNGKEIPRSKFGQNLQLLLPSLYKSDSTFIDKPLMNYYIHKGSHSEQKSLSRSIELLEGYEGIRLQMLDLFDDAFEDLRLKMSLSFYERIMDTILSYNGDNTSLYDHYYKGYRDIGGKDVKYRMYESVLHREGMQYFWRAVHKIQSFLTKPGNE